MARIVLLCPQDEKHVLGCLIRLDPQIQEPAGRNVAFSSWSDGQGTVVVQRWGRHGALGVNAPGDDSAPSSIDARCETCLRQRLPGHQANPGLVWWRAVAMLDHVQTQRITTRAFRDQRLQMRW